MSFEKLGGAMDDEVGPELDGTLDVGAGEGVIDDHEGVVCVSDVTRPPQVRYTEDRVGGRLEEEHLRRRTHGRFDGAGVRRIDVAEVELVFAEDLLEQAVGAAVGVVGHHHVVAGLEQGHDGAFGRHARGEREARRSAFDGGHIGFERRPRRVLRARVLVPLVLPERLLHVGGRLINRDGDRAGRGVGLLARVHTDSGEPCVIS